MTYRHHLRSRAARGRGARVLGVCVAVVVAATACSSDDGSSDGGDDERPSSSAPASSPSSTDPEAAQKREVLDAYAGYWREQVKAYAAGSIKGTKLTGYVSGEPLGEVKSDVKRLRDNGFRYQGKPGHDAEVSRLSPDGEGKGKLPVAEVSDCLDISSWKSVDRKTGKEQPLPEGQPEQFELTVTMEDWGDKGEEGWVVIKHEPSTREC